MTLVGETDLFDTGGKSETDTFIYWIERDGEEELEVRGCERDSQTDILNI